MYRWRVIIVCVYVLPLDLRDNEILLFIHVFQWIEWNVKGQKYKDCDLKMYRCEDMTILTVLLCSAILNH